jgi:polysaccharide pyruvyl transferase WcaK-like protein
MKRIAVICAYPKHNPGMYSVDLGLGSIVNTLEKVKVTRFNIQDNYSIKSDLYKLKYNLLYDAAQLENFDKIIIWGDFLLWLLYGKHEILSKQRKNLTYDQIFEKWSNLIFLKNRPDLQKKVIIYGTTLYGINSEQLSNNDYLSMLSELCDNAQSISFRDVFSANFISQISQNKNVSYRVDCAFHFNTDKILKNIQDSPYLCYSFGRSGCDAKLEEFAKEVANSMNLNAVNLNWLDKSGLPGLINKISVIKGSSGLITDIYHCGITGMRESVPVIGIGMGASTISSTLSDKKKEVFFTQSFANQNYIYAESILNPENKTNLIADTCLKLSNSHAHEIINSFIKKKTESDKDSLIFEILN